MSDEYEIEPIRGLPGDLPAGETLVWQGAPSFAALSRRTVHTPLIAGYFAVLITLAAINAATDHVTVATAIKGIGMTAAVGGFAIGLLSLYAWVAARTTVYTITSRRVVMRFGIALPKCINLPFAQLAGAGLQVHADTTGDLPLTLKSGSRVGYALLWPHVRPWRISSPQPMLRGVADPETVARLLATALAATASGQRHAIGASTGPTAAEVFAPPASVAA